MTIEIQARPLITKCLSDTGALALEQRVDGIHLGEDKYKQGVVPPVLNPFSFTGWTPQRYRLGTQGLNRPGCV